MNDLTDAEISVLNEALDDEYHSWAIYDQVITDFGEIQPFSNIRDAEERHIEALRTLFTHYGLSVPDNHWSGKIIRYPNRKAACEAGVAAEIANGEMYKRLIKVVENSDIRRVLNNLQEASQERHLPAFERCLNESEESRCSGDVHRVSITYIGNFSK